ncbi:MAG: hypothetical protein E7458_02845 [Ruminococcaceae bacterium]|nr:hypothetical protein [Oscillospiraceae bacterium]
MIPENELLQYIHKTAEIGCEGILAVMDAAEDTGLKKELSRQLAEYRGFERDAEELLRRRGSFGGDVSTMSKLSARAMSAGKLLLDRSPSHIAEMTIEGNNMGISKTLQHLHDYGGGHPETLDLANRFLAAQRANVESLQPYL